MTGVGPILESLEARLLLSSDPASVSHAVLASGPGEIRLEYVFPELELQATGAEKSGRVISHAVLGDAPSFGDAGQPVLPAVPVQIALPPGTEVAGVEVATGTKVTLDGSYLIEHGTEYVRTDVEGAADSLDASAAGTFDASVYASDSPFPYERFEVIGVQRRRGVDILVLNLRPVEYVAASGKVAWFDSMAVTVRLAEADPKAAADSLAIEYRPGTAAALAESVDNPDVLAAYEKLSAPLEAPVLGFADPADTYEYVVITGQAMVDATTDYTIGDFLAHKRAQGFTATVVTTEQIYAGYTGVDAAEQLRNFIIDAYNNWETDYVLLGGDVNVVPYRSLRATAEGEVDDLPSDLYFQCLDGTFDYDGDGIWGEPNDGPGGGEVDMMAEVYIGRAAAEDADEMANWVYKIIQYENDPSSAHRSNALMLGEYLGFQFGPGRFSYAEPGLEEIRLGASSAGYTTAGFAADPDITVDTLYDINGEWSAGELVTMLNSDTYGLINHDGHADTPYVMKLYNSDADALTNDSFFFVYSQGCYPGNFEGDAIAEHLTTSTRHGAIGVVFNSRYGWGAYNDSVETFDSPSQRLDRQFWDATFGEEINRLGPMNADSHEDNIWGIGQDIMRWVIFESNLLGDPATEVRSTAVDGVDLRGEDFDVEPDNLRISGGAVTVSLTVSNRGLAAAGAFDVQFYYSDDDVIDASDMLLSIWDGDPAYDASEPHAYHVGGLAAGGELASAVSVVVPTADPFGTDNDYYIGMIVDADFDVAEVYEDNNSSRGLYRDLDDVYYDFAGPTVESHTPAGGVADPQSAIRFQFDEPIDPASFSVADDVVSFTGPSGDLMGEITEHSWVSDTVLEVQFAAQSAFGIYTMTIGPDVADESGNLMNADGDAANGEAVQDAYTASFAIVDAIYLAGMDSDPGWTLDPGSGEYQWQWGVPTGGGSGPGGPTAGFTGSAVMGYDLAGDYADMMFFPEYATTPAIDCTGFEQVTLSFYRWLGVESSEYDSAAVQVSHDGLSWVDLWSNPVQDVFDDSWVYQEFDISAVADDQPTVYVRWAMGPTDYSVTYCGWNIDDVMVIGAPMGPDSRGPAVTSHSPAGQVGGGQAVMAFTFDEAMDTSSFSAADDVVSFVGPAGDLAGEITGFTWRTSRILEVQFTPQTNVGTYTMTIGPGITDDSGNAMNTDGDAVNGEADDDLYAGSFEVIDVIYYAGMGTDPGWTLDPTPGGDGWEWGTPTGGGSHNGDPSSGYTGGNVIGYNLSGDYEDFLFDPEYATTPAIDCSGFEGVTLSFYRWLGVESSYYDHAAVQVSNDGAVWHDVWVHTQLNITDTSWTYQQFDISAAADDQPAVYIRWAMGPTDLSVTYPGWNIDDVKVVGTPAGPDTRGPSVRSHSPSGTVGSNQAAIAFRFDDSMDASSFAVADDVVSFVGPSGDLLGEITGFEWTATNELEVRFGTQTAAGTYTMVVGPDILDDAGNPMDTDGDGTSGEAMQDRYAASFTITDAIYFADMNSDPGWTIEGGSGDDRWQWGAPAGGGSHNGDPTSGYTGDYVFGYNLAGDYPNNLYDPEYATTPAIDCSEFTGVTLSFYRWLGVEQYQYDGADVWVSNDWLNWEPVWVNPEQDLSESSWTYVEYDISAVADGQSTVYVSWGMGPTDGLVTFPGWNIDDVALTGTPAGPDVTGPAVTGHSPSFQTGLNQTSVRFTFDDAMDTSSFAVADDVVNFTGPSGNLMSRITGYAWVDDRTLEVQFDAQSELGAYTMIIGPEIADDAGNAMDQDGDGVAGEPVTDRYVATFEIVDAIYFAGMDGDPGWDLDPSSNGPGWQWGTPTGGGPGGSDPTSGYTGDNVMGYNLSGDYPSDMDPQWAVTPAIDCSGFENVTLSFYRWLGVETREYDEADLWVSADGEDWVEVWLNPNHTVTDTQWTYQEYDISDVADDEPTVYIGWCMGPTDGWYEYPGWNIDDVKLSGTATAPDVLGPGVIGHSPAGNVGRNQRGVSVTFDEEMDTASFSIADDVVSFTGPAGDLTGEITGFAWRDGRTLEVQFAPQSAVGAYELVIGPNVLDRSGNAMDVNGDAANGETPDDQYHASFNVIDAIYFAGMDGDPGWELDPSSNGPGWQWGPPTGGGSDVGDPASGYTGGNVLGYNLSGDYQARMRDAEWATTPAIDCSGYENVTLSFYRWLGVERRMYDEADIYASNDGVNWVEVWANPDADLMDDGWTYQEYDLSEVADDQATVYVSWGMGPSDISYTYPGWNIDDVALTSYHAPLGADDAYHASPAEPLNASAAEGVLANDVALSGGALTAVRAGDPIGGDLTLHPDGSFGYQPWPEFYGTDSFTYVADDGRGQSDPRTVTLNVAVAGDADMDERVDFRDYVCFKAAVGTAGGATWGEADFNCDGAVDRDDFAVLVANIGRSYTSPSPKYAAVALDTVEAGEPVIEAAVPAPAARHALMARRTDAPAPVPVLSAAGPASAPSSNGATAREEPLAEAARPLPAAGEPVDVLGIARDTRLSVVTVSDEETSVAAAPPADVADAALTSEFPDVLASQVLGPL